MGEEKPIGEALSQRLRNGQVKNAEAASAEEVSAESLSESRKELRFRES